MSRPPLRMVPAAGSDRKRRRLERRTELAYEAGFSGTATAHTFQAVATPDGPAMREVAIDVPVPILPVPSLPLPISMDDLTWAHKDPVVPLAQLGSTPYVTADTSSNTASAVSLSRVVDLHVPGLIFQHRRILPCHNGGSFGTSLAMSSTAWTHAGRRTCRMHAAYSAAPPATYRFDAQSAATGTCSVVAVYVFVTRVSHFIKFRYGLIF
jgi:hypothetical protein